MESFISTRPDECPSKFQVLPKHWIVERSFSWLENFRKLTIDYEFLAETMVQIAFIQIMLILLAALICAFSRLSHLSSRICARTLYVHRWLFQAKPKH